ncbi:MAG: bis(5'-nucleosyl)-tetraphosphatase (symmetrical) YqeK [Clostridiales bacterium]|nr:bis(5'-nucleosyl)-tetraphosphatase (symmetrical) YqeK [Clostridiales bacterium]
MRITGGQWRLWLQMLRQAVSEQRYEHCRRVAGEAVRLARHYGFDEEMACLAGLTHDVARDLPPAELLERAACYGLTIGPDEEINPIILHAPVGAAILEREWHITDTAVLTAVSLHTVAAPAMDEFSQLLYLADLIEPGRKKWPELPQLRALSYRHTGLAMVMALEGNFRYLTACHNFIHPRATAAYEFFRKKSAEY